MLWASIYLLTKELMLSTRNLIGRFAPSPSGPLHMGSLIAAVASYCDIKHLGGRWHVRIDDVDPLRIAPNACTSILQTLNAHGLHSDIPVDYQSQHSDAYSDALNQLTPQSFFCTCSRKQLKTFAVYPGRCRQKKAPTANSSTRISVGDNKITFHDLILGSLEHDLGVAPGDFIIRRKDGLTAYNLATAVDDGAEITHVVRGQDLYPTTAAQIHIMQILGLSPPIYAHIPVLTFADGKKLSKQHFAPALNNAIATENLRNAFTYLGIHIRKNDRWTVQKMLDWGTKNWDLKKIPTQLPLFLPKT